MLPKFWKHVCTFDRDLLACLEFIGIRKPLTTEPPTSFARTAEAVRDEFAERGITIREWARSEGFSEKLVYYVLTGKRTPRRGASYRIALALGMRAPQANRLDHAKK